MSGAAHSAGQRAVTITAVRGLSRFAQARGIAAGREFWLDYDVIEAFCVAGLPGCASSTRGTYRSALYRLARPVHGEPVQRATPFAGAKAPAPYSPAERAGLAAMAAAQRDPATRASALAVVVFGIGAGLRTAELAALRGSDVSCRDRRVMVRVSGPATRVVPVIPAYAGRAAGLAAAAGNAHLFRPGPADRGYKNSGRRESNPHDHLGRTVLVLYTSDAYDPRQPGDAWRTKPRSTGEIGVFSGAST